MGNKWDYDSGILYMSDENFSILENQRRVKIRTYRLTSMYEVEGYIDSIVSPFL